MAVLYPLFQEKGLRGFRMQHYAEILGVSKATLYKYFASREELLTYLTNWKLNQIQGFEQHLFDPELPYLDRFTQALKIASSHIAGLSNRFLADLKDMHPQVWEQITAFIDSATVMLENFYKEGQEHGAFLNMHTAVLTIADKVMLMQLTDPDFLKSSGLKVHEALESYFIMKFSGIFNREKVDEKRMQQLLSELVEDLRSLDDQQ